MNPYTCWCTECRRVKMCKPQVFQGRIVCRNCWDMLQKKDREKIERKFSYDIKRNNRKGK